MLLCRKTKATACTSRSLVHLCYQRSRLSTNTCKASKRRYRIALCVLHVCCTSASCAARTIGSLACEMQGVRITGCRLLVPRCACDVACRCQDHYHELAISGQMGDDQPPVYHGVTSRLQHELCFKPSSQPGVWWLVCPARRTVLSSLAELPYQADRPPPPTCTSSATFLSSFSPSFCYTASVATVPQAASLDKAKDLELDFVCAFIYYILP